MNQRAGIVLIIAYLGFISLGLPDAITGIAWPSVRERFELSQSSFGLVSLTMGCGYFLSSFFGGRLTHLLGLGTLLTTSSLAVAVAMFGDATAPEWWIFIACGVLWGLGSGAIDAGLNAFVASHFSAKHVSWLHACYSLGATTGPLVMTATLAQLGSWRTGYAIVGAVMLAMSGGFLLTRGQWSDHSQELPADVPLLAEMLTVLRSPIVVVQVVIFYLYTGLECTIGSWTYTLLTEARGMRPEPAGIWVAVYFGAIGIGRVVFGPVADRVGLDRLVRLSILAAIVGAGLFAFASPVSLSLIGLPILGIGLASIFPTLMTRTPQRLGAAFAAHAVGFQVSAAMLGAATLPALTGLLVERLSLESAAWMGVLLTLLMLAMHELLLRITATAPR